MGVYTVEIFFLNSDDQYDFEIAVLADARAVLDPMEVVIWDPTK